MMNGHKFGAGLIVAAAAVAFLVVGAMVVHAGGRPGGVLAGLHGGQGACPMQAIHAQFEEIRGKLNLTAEQKGYLDRAHQILKDKFHQKEQAHGADKEALLAAIGNGTLDKAQVRAMIDEHLSELRTTAYGVSDELIGFVNSLDATQRALLRDELAKLHDEVHQAIAEHHSAADGK